MIPKVGGEVMVLQGAFRRDRAVVKEIGEHGTLQLISGDYKGRIIEKIEFEEFSKIHIE